MPSWHASISSLLLLPIVQLVKYKYHKVMPQRLLIFLKLHLRAHFNSLFLELISKSIPASLNPIFVALINIIIVPRSIQDYHDMFLP